MTSAQQLLHLQMEDGICWKAPPLHYHYTLQKNCFRTISQNNHPTFMKAFALFIIQMMRIVMSELTYLCGN